MALDSAVQDFLQAKPDSGDADAPVQERRRAIREASDRMFATYSEFGPEVHEVFTRTVPAGGSLRLKVYRPSDQAGLPVHVFFHGGAFWLGSVDELVVDATCRERCLGANVVVVSVDYGLAPEHPYPGPVEDGLAALAWTVAHAAELGGDAENVTIGGVSAGATLAAAVALRSRELDRVRLRGQILEVPLLDLTLKTLQQSGVGDSYGIRADELQLCTDLYLPSPEVAAEAGASPLLAADLGGAPAAWILTAEFDPLRDDGAHYAARLNEAGVAAEHFRAPGAVHGSIVLTRTWAPARAWRERVLGAIVAAHRTAF